MILMELLIHSPQYGKEKMTVFFNIFRRIRPVFLLSIIGSLLIIGCDSGYSTPSKDHASDDQPKSIKRGLPKMGSVSPPFQLLDLQGNQIALADYRGKVVLLNFWATWCAPCRVEMPAMEKLYQDLQMEGLEVLAISIDPQGLVVTQPFQEAMGLTFTILHDSDYQVGAAYGARTLPMTYLIDRKGIIRQRIFGARDWSGTDARQLIRSLL